MKDTVLEVKDIKKEFVVSRFGRKKKIYALNGVSFDLKKGEVLGIVGESGCGKTTLGRVISKIYEPTSGECILNVEGKEIDIAKLDEKKFRSYRKYIQMIFQDPFASLNPRLTIYTTLYDVLKAHGIGNKDYRNELIEKTIKEVGLENYHLFRYPHEFSGGQRQRISIARALILNPDIIIADEPVSALDVSIQSQIINLMLDIREKFGVSYIFISHDISVVRYISDKVMVMYLGFAVEKAPVDVLFDRPLHPYTKALLSAILTPDPKKERTRKKMILQGDVPDPSKIPMGCVFADRCPIKKDICEKVKPEEREIEKDHFVSCHFA
ncbi:MAG TPA: ATP-binding cassette domain-containing protein [Thermotogaceae bacterium]|nr:ATP-binding cassette domain-containing protein [Thermotogota bacterium]HEW92365.1 ATP-binding cassette domain-containing protein [Thermotogaceae bacterium]